MKTLLSALLMIVLAVALSSEAMAATITGNIAYTGASTGQIYIVVFTDSTLRVRSNIMAQLGSPGSYALPGLSDGTYFIVSLMMTDSNGTIQLTDPWGGYGTEASLTPVTVTGGNNVPGINITLVDGTVSKPNPFYRKPVVPNRTIQLADVTRPGKDPSLVYDGSSLYVCKHDAQNAPGAKIFKINPATGDITNTYIVSLSSSANGICWMGRLTYHKGAFWSAGGYGDPAGTDKGIVGVFKIDIATSTSSNQLPAAAGIDTTNEFGGIASDGVNLYVGVDLQNSSLDRGVVKFDPSLVSVVPASPFFKLNIRPSYLCYADNFLWAGVDSVLKMNPANGANLAGYNMPGGAAQVYLDGMFWMYDQSDNTLKAYALQPAGVAEGNDTPLPSIFHLSQNYPNPFNPSTSIAFGLPTRSLVTLKIFDVIGREIATLVSEELPAGNYSRQWNAAGMSSGIYFYRLQAGTSMETKKLLLLR